MARGESAHLIGVAVSGRGSNLKALLEYQKNKPDCGWRIDWVISDQPQAPALTIAKDYGVHVLEAPYQGTRSEYGCLFIQQIERFNPSLIVLAGFMRILPPNVIQRFRSCIINLHPSLLPKYRGLNTHRRVIEAGEKEHGCTVHIATEKLDDGTILDQDKLQVSPDDTEESLARRVRELEHKLLPRVIGNYLQQRKLHTEVHRHTETGRRNPLWSGQAASRPHRHGGESYTSCSLA